MGTDTPFLYRCHTCGKHVDLRVYQPKERLLGNMFRNRECYDCAYWRDLSVNRPANSYVIGNSFIIGGYTESDPFVTILPRTLYIWLHSRVAARLNYITFAGDIPTRFQPIFPSEGVFIDRKLYTRLKNHDGYVCKKKGCYDRYQCIFYIPELIEPDGAWNKLPENYQPGWEECPLFINKNSLCQ